MPQRMAVPRVLACLAVLAAAACAQPEKPQEVQSQDTIACQLENQRVVIRFLPDEIRMLTPDGERVVLQKVPASSGIRYTNGLVEIRGGSFSPTAQQGLQFVRDGDAWPLTNCQPLMVPPPAK